MMIMLTFALTSLVHATECGQFLSRYLRHAEAQISPIALNVGRAENVEQNVFLSRGELDHYLEQNPFGPWTAELGRVSADDFQRGQLVYLSPLGPTLWPAEEFGRWLKLIASDYGRDFRRAERVIGEIVRGERYQGLSERSHARLRNAFLASITEFLALAESDVMTTKVTARGNSPFGDLDELGVSQPHDRGRAEFFAQFLAPVEPEPLVDLDSGKPIDFRTISPPSQDAYRQSVERELSRRRAERAGHDMRRSAPSLWLNFSFNDTVRRRRPIKAPTDAFEINDPSAARWTARITLRESLVRRKLIPDVPQSKRTLGERLTDDQIFLLAAFPELAPYWPVVATMDVKMDEVPLNDPMTSIFNLPPLIINQLGDECRVCVGRPYWEPTQREEVMAVELRMGNGPALEDAVVTVSRAERQRFQHWFNYEWRAFRRLTHAPKKRRPKLLLTDYGDEVVLHYPGVSPALVLGFYVYLFNKYAP